MKVLVKKHSFSTWVSLISLLFFLNACEAANDLIGVNATVSKIEGEWTCDETSEIFKSTSSAYTVTISADADNVNGVIIDNFYGVNISVRANVSGTSIIIGNQAAEDGYQVSGSGTITSNFEKINLNYNVNDGSGVIDHVTAVYTKVK